MSNHDLNIQSSRGKHVVIGENVQLGEGVVIGHHVIIYDGTTIGNNVVIQDHAVIGKQPTKAKNSILKETANLAATTIADGCTIGTSSIIYAGSTLDQDVYVADLATIRERVSIGAATIVGRGAAIENDCSIGERCKLETNCYITAYSTLGHDVFIAPCVVTSNDPYMGRTKERFSKIKGVTVENGARIGANATTLPGVVIEKEGMVAAGSVVTKNVAAYKLVKGIPARPNRDVPEEQWVKNQRTNMVINARKDQ
jgi:acetyltransferase-like isoleucine patch superfamily enzyme